MYETGSVTQYVCVFCLVFMYAYQYHTHNNIHVSPFEYETNFGMAQSWLLAADCWLCPIPIKFY